MRLPSIFSRKSRARQPETRPIGRTGDARFVPQIAHWERGRGGRVVCQAHRLDQIAIRDYDRVRFYPVIRDGTRMLRLATRRTNFHFTSSRQDIADLCQKELGPHIPNLIGTLMRGSLEFGWQAVAKRWKPDFQVSVTTGQQAGGSAGERLFPFVWTIDRFASFSPEDTHILINERTGDFAGVRQWRAAMFRQRDVLARDCIHFVNDQEFDGNYGVPITKAAVPFVESAESVLDDMSRYSNIFGSPWKKGKYPSGRLPTGQSGGEPEFVDNGSLMLELLDGLESAHSIALPSECNVEGNPRWDVEIVTVPAEDRYVPKLQFLNDMIRMAIAFPQMASSSAPDSGTYNLGQTQIDLFLANVQAYLDQLSEVINAQLVKDFVLYNFGPSAPDCTLVMEPVDFSAKQALLKALVDFLSTGQPLQDAGGSYIYPNWAKMAEDLGLPVLNVDPRKAAGDLVAAAQERLRQLAGNTGIRVADPDPAKDGTQVESYTRKDGTQQTPQLSEFEESEHPRDGDGRFASKAAIGTFVGSALDGDSNEHRLLPIGDVSNEVANQIKGLAGFDPQGWKHEIDNYAIRHAMDEHGDANSEKARGLIAITPEDFQLVPDILAAPDEIEYRGQSKQGTDLVRYSKAIGDTLVYVEEALAGKNAMRMKTMWKRSATPRAN